MQHLQRLNKSWGLMAGLRQLAGTTGSACEAPAATAAAATRCNSSAAVGGGGAAAAEAATAATSRMVPHQANKAAQRPAVSGRKAFDRSWAKNLQIKASLGGLQWGL